MSRLMAPVQSVWIWWVSRVHSSKTQQVVQTQQISEKVRKKKETESIQRPLVRVSCRNWRCSHPYSLGCGKWTLSAGPALSLGFVFHALRSRTNWVSVSFCSVAHYPRERLKSILSQATLHNTTKKLDECTLCSLSHQNTGHSQTQKNKH